MNNPPSPRRSLWLDRSTFIRASRLGKLRPTHRFIKFVCLSALLIGSASYGMDAHQQPSHQAHIREAYVTCLYKSFRTLAARSMKLYEICNLTIEARECLGITLNNELEELSNQLDTNNSILNNLMSPKKFNDITSAFTSHASQHLTNALNCPNITDDEFTLYALQHSRNTSSAILQATREIVERYHISKNGVSINNNKKEENL